LRANDRQALGDIRLVVDPVPVEIHVALLKVDLERAAKGGRRALDDHNLARAAYVETAVSDLQDHRTLNFQH
jgi:hypothetical protein